MIHEVSDFLIDGCGRCSLYKTPQCKVHTWAEELRYLREIILNSELKEEYKWSQPCYTLGKKNVLLVTAFKDFATITFFKGALLNDPKNILVSPGENSQAVKQLRFTDVQTIIDQQSIIKSYIQEAIEIEKSGAKVEFKKDPNPIPEELYEKFEEDSEYEKAFYKLTPGRQRGYLLHFSQAAQSKTRASRIDKSFEKIKLGKGFNER